MILPAIVARVTIEAYKNPRSANKAVGKVDMGGTACKIPDALVAIEKIESSGKLGSYNVITSALRMRHSDDSRRASHRPAAEIREIVF
jgi:hypothetical protein